MKLSPTLIAWPIAAVVLFLRWTCRVRIHDDPRARLRAAGKRYAYSILHAHQIAATMYAEPKTAAMVSRSSDGDLLIRAFHALGIVPVRGSGRSGEKDRGGAAALSQMVKHVEGGDPAIIAVDGPRGPRGHARKGIASLSQRADAAILNVILIPRWRIRMPRAWDRFQVPLPFSRVDAYFAEPIYPQRGEGVEGMRRRVEVSLNDLERQHDPSEASQLRQAPYRLPTAVPALTGQPTAIG